MTGMIGLINQGGRQMVVIVCEKYPRGVGLCRSRWGGRPEKIFSNVEVFLDIEVTCDTSKTSEL